MMYAFILGMVCGTLLVTVASAFLLMREAMRVKAADLENKNWMYRNEEEWELEAMLTKPPIPERWRV